MSRKLNKYSSRITAPKSQGASQAMLYGTGLTEKDMAKAEVGIASVWWEGNTCNMHLNDLAAYVKEGVEAAGLVGMRFNTIGVSDGISMGTEGMSYSLQSREIIADSIETVMGAQWYDANISIPGCDKNMPGCMIAIGRLNRPALMIYGGTIKPGHHGERTLDIVSAFQSYGEFIAGRIDEPTREGILVNKSTVNFRADFKPIAEEILVCKAPGPMLADPSDFPWKRLATGIRTKPNGSAFAGVSGS